ncbi:MAG: acyltransferase [Patescibacteria group bacterium]|nr:acyltransferase [Patescibacteria group bacterium]
MPAKPYNPAIDLLRFIAIMAVVLIHTATRTMEMTHYDLYQTPWSLLFHQVTRFAVPLFFLISGFVLELNHDAKTNYWQYLKKRLNRIFIPYVFWSAFYFYFVYNQHGSDFLSALINGSASHQLYFIPALLVFYLIFPLLHWFYRFFANKWVLLILAAVQLWFLYADYYLRSLHIFYPLAVAAYNFYPFVFGMVVSHYHHQLMAFVKKWLAILIPLTVFLGAYIFYSGRYLYYQTYDIGYFYSNWRPQVLLYTLAFFAVTYYLFSKIIFNTSLVKTLSSLSFFVFFVHIIVLEKIWGLIGTPLQPTFWSDSAFFLATAVISLSLAWIGHKIPFLSRLTG